MNNLDKLLQNFTKFFQSNFELIINDNVFKSGRFINISEKEYFVKFLFLDKKHNKLKSIEIPIPFDMKATNNCIILDYTLNTLCGDNDNLLLDIKKISLTNPSAFYDKKIIFKFDNSINS